MIHFVYGRAGSGKTALLFDLIKKLSKEESRVLILVPEQQVFEYEKLLCDLGLCSLTTEVAGFRRLANMIFRKWGFLAYHYIGSGAKLIVMWKTLKALEGVLREYVGLTLDDLSLLELLQRTVEEFERYNVTPAQLEAAANALTDKDEKLKRKLLDLSMIMTLDLELLSKDYDNPEDDLPRAAKLLSDHDFFADTTVIIDGFSHFAPVELEIIGHIFRGAVDTYVSVPCRMRDSGEMMDNIRKTDRRLRSLAKELSCTIADPIECTDIVSTQKEDLIYLREHIWTFGNDAFDAEPQNIRLFETSDAYSEAEYVACEISRLVFEEKCRYREIAIVARDPDSYKGILDIELEKYNIPYFMSSRTGLCMKPCVRMICAVFSILSRGWKREDIVSYMRCGLSGLSPDECDIIDEYSKAWDISGELWYSPEAWTMNPRGFSTEFTDEDVQKLEIIEMLRHRLVDRLSAFGEIFDTDPTVREISAQLFKFLQNAEIPRILAELEAKDRACGDLAAAEETVQIWDAIVGALDSLVVVAGDMRVSAASYLKLLLAIFENIDIGKVPAGVDEVIVGEPKLLHKPGVKYCFILGLNEGVFPTFGSESQIFGDADKEKLETLGIELADNSESAAVGELYSFYRAISLPSDGLYLSFNSDKNRSVALMSVCSIFPHLMATKWLPDADADKIWGTKSALSFGAANYDNSDGRAVWELAASVGAEQSANLSREALSCPLDESSCVLSAETAELLVGLGLSLTQARVENFVKCPFSYYAKNVLSLKEELTVDFEARNVGDYLHSVFEHFFVGLCGRDIRSLSPDELTEHAERALAECKNRIVSGRVSPRLEHLFEKLRVLALLLIHNMAAEFANSDFSPVLFELAIDNKRGNIEPLKIKFGDNEHGREKYITVYGRVDRVDAYKKGNDVYLRVIDYKTGKKDFSLSDLRLGLDFQLPIYLLSLCRTTDPTLKKKLGAEENDRLLPAAFLYFSARMPDLPKVDSPLPNASDVEESLSASVARSGLIVNDPNIVSAMEHGARGRFIPVKYDKNGCIKKSGSLIDAAGLDELMTTITDKISSVGEQIASGEASARPLRESEIDPCKYCEARKLCRISIKNS